MMATSVFISYRRDGGEMAAQTFSKELREKGYHVFYDIESLGVGLFNGKILQEIEQANVFLLVLSKGALDRCVNEGDWVRREIAHALKCQKPILPVFFRGFEFPSDLPWDIAPVELYNGLNMANMEHYEDDLEKLYGMIEEAVARKEETEEPIPSKPAKPKAVSVEETYAEAEKMYDRFNYQDAFPLLQKGAEEGHADSQFLLGELYRYGWGVKQDGERAFQAYHSAAVQGHVEAQLRLAWDCYGCGIGVQKDKQLELKWMRAAAEQGHPEAQYVIGSYYEDGVRVGFDDLVISNAVKAFEWYEKAAEQGYAEGQYHLGQCYEKGKIVKKNLRQAKKWYRKAAKQGHKMAEHSLKRLRWHFW